MFYWLSYTKHMIINKVTMHIMINLIQMLPIFVFEIRLAIVYEMRVAP